MLEKSSMITFKTITMFWARLLAMTSLRCNQNISINNVIVKGSCAEIVGACLQRSHILWSAIQVLKLTENMHLNTHVEAEKSFAKWQLEVGHVLNNDRNGLWGYSIRRFPISVTFSLFISFYLFYSFTLCIYISPVSTSDYSQSFYPTD